MHSWRALILPYAGEDGLAAAYNFKEPWDGPNNVKLASRMPYWFRCPSNQNMPANMTSYFCVTGPGRMKAGSKEQRHEDFLDKPTIVLVESASARVNWLEPRDLSVSDVLQRKNTKSRPSVSSFHSIEDSRRRSGKFFNCACQDASVCAIRDDVDRKTLEALLTIDGGEEVDVSKLRPTYPNRIWPKLWLILLTLAFVAFFVIRRLPLLKRTSTGGEAPDA